MTTNTRVEIVAQCMFRLDHGEGSWEACEYTILKDAYRENARAILAALDAVEGCKMYPYFLRPDWRHIKRGTLYEEIGQAELQNANGAALSEGVVLVIYQGADGKLWAREKTEFNDGRFEPLSAPPSDAGGGE